MTQRVYLDWNATTPLRPEARAAMTTAFEAYGNPSSVHAEGRVARGLVEGARESLAKALGASPARIIFTSGGSEANALALLPGLQKDGGAPLSRLIVSAIEHPSVLAGGRFSDTDIARAPVTPEGLLDLDALAALLEGQAPALVSVMLANNETGAIQPVRQAADLVHGHGGLLHVDAVQGFGKIPCRIEALGADLLTVSAHKIGGPKGVGALILAQDGLVLPPLIRGGGQERSRRAGTENVIGIAGFGAAVEAAMQAMANEAGRLESLRAQCEAGLMQHPGTVIFAKDALRLPNTILFAAPGFKAETALIGFDLAGIALSSGSACSSGKVRPSHVLEAMGVTPGLAGNALRLSMGWTTTESDIQSVLNTWNNLARVLGKKDAALLRQPGS